MDAVTKDLISGDKGKLAGSGLGNGLFVGPGLREGVLQYSTSPLPYLTSGNVLGDLDSARRITE